MKQTIQPYDSILNIRRTDPVLCLKALLNFKSKLLEEEAKEVIIDDKAYIECTVKSLSRNFKEVRDGLLGLTDGIYSYLNDKVIIDVRRRLTTGELINEEFEVDYKDLLSRGFVYREHYIAGEMLKPFINSGSTDLEYFKYRYISKLDFSNNFPIGKSVDLLFRVSQFKNRFAEQFLSDKSVTDLSLSGTIKETYYSDDTLYLRITLNKEYDNIDLINIYKTVFDRNEIYFVNINENEITLPYYSRFIKDNDKYSLGLTYKKNKHFQDKNILLQELESEFIRKIPDYSIFVIDKVLFPLSKYRARIVNNDEQKIIIESLYGNRHLNHLTFYKPTIAIVVNDKEDIDEILSDVKNIISKVNNN